MWIRCHNYHETQCLIKQMFRLINSSIPERQFFFLKLNHYKSTTKKQTYIKIINWAFVLLFSFDVNQTCHYFPSFFLWISSSFLRSHYATVKNISSFFSLPFNSEIKIYNQFSFRFFENIYALYLNLFFFVC